jgi:hypothetical protein
MTTKRVVTIRVDAMNNTPDTFPHSLVERDDGASRFARHGYD